MQSLLEIPEVGGWRSARGLVRIPPELDVPMTPRVRRVIDSAAFRRLAQISQLGLVSLVYPAANHSRQEHSLGVFRVAVDFLSRLAEDERFAELVSREDAELFLVTALLHDVGHWPFCHPIEDMSLAGIPTHEHFAANFLRDSSLSQILDDDWGTSPQEICRLLAGDVPTQAGKILAKLLSSPIDVDKVDYLMRDSLHAGVPYGRHFDQQRLIASLCLNQAGDGIAISEKGKTAAEMMVFSRYVMFSEVYWHHAVRSATAMLQRAFYNLHDKLDLDQLFRLTEVPFIQALMGAGQGTPAEELLAGLFGQQRRLYKRAAQFSYAEDPEVFQQIARRPYPQLVEGATNLAADLSKSLGESFAPHEILIDSPPVKLEVQFDLDVYFPKEKVYRRLGEISPVVSSLAREQFDSYVKRVRLFVHPRLVDQVTRLDGLGERVVGAMAD